MKLITVEMANGLIYDEHYEGYINLDSIVDGLNDDRTKFMSIGNFVCKKSEVETITIEEVEKTEVKDGSN